MTAVIAKSTKSKRDRETNDNRTHQHRDTFTTMSMGDIQIGSRTFAQRMNSFKAFYPASQSDARINKIQTQK